MPDIWGLAAIATKAFLYLGILTASGMVMAALVFRLDNLRKPAVGFAVLGLAATVLDFMLRAANLTGDVSGMTDPEMLGLLWSTPVGTVFALRIGGLGVLLTGLLFGRRGLWLSVFGAWVAIWSFQQVGHVASRDDLLLDLALLLHLTAIAFWIGILAPLARLAANPATHVQAARVGHRFGQIATVAVPVLIIAGAYMGYRLTGTVTALLMTGYGQALLLKTGSVAALLGLAAANKLRFIPALANGDTSAATRLLRAIAAEWLAISVILIVTATLTTHLTLPS